MFDWFRRYRRRRLLQTYARTLGPELKKRYGIANTYTPAQIKAAGIAADLSPALLGFGFSIFLSRADFDQVQRPADESANYDELRQEIGNACFGGDTNFDGKDVIAQGPQNSAFALGGSEHDGGGEGGAGDGGGGGGA